MREKKHTDGIGRWWGWPSRHRPPRRTATADTAQGERQRAHLPGAPGSLHTARTATDTWHADPSDMFPQGPSSGNAQAPAGDSG